jgi:hypothetical protein
MVPFRDYRHNTPPTIEFFYPPIASKQHSDNSGGNEICLCQSMKNYAILGQDLSHGAANPTLGPRPYPEYLAVTFASYA